MRIHQAPLLHGNTAGTAWSDLAAGAWARAKLAFCTALALMAMASTSAAAQGRIYLLGEVHDNPQAHAQRLDLIDKLLAGDFRPVIAMEQFDRDQQPALDQAMATCPDADCVVQLAGGQGWDWNFYKPVIATALRRGLPLIAANLSPLDARKIARGDLGAALSPQVLQDFHLDRALDGELYAQQQKAIDIGHCHALPASAFPGMVNAQVGRDVWMAKTVRENAAQGLILLAGNGHVRKDIGVYHWLGSAERARTQVFAFTEDASESGAEGLVYDQSIRVEPFAREDPCAALTGKVKAQT